MIVQGRIDKLSAHKGIHAFGERSDAIVIDGGSIPLEGNEVAAHDGQRIREVGQARAD